MRRLRLHREARRPAQSVRRVLIPKRSRLFRFCPRAEWRLLHHRRFLPRAGQEDRASTERRRRPCGHPRRHEMRAAESDPVLDGDLDEFMEAYLRQS